jgi:ABC-type proline/glycine betaine transport system ATPase subunit
MVFEMINDQRMLVAVVSREIVTSPSNQYVDKFVDKNVNLYHEAPHSDAIDLIQLSPILINKAEAFYQMQGLKVQA